MTNDCNAIVTFYGATEKNWNTNTRTFLSDFKIGGQKLYGKQ